MTKRPLADFWTQDHVEKLRYLTRKAGSCLLEHQPQASRHMSIKDDGSPVSIADHRSQEIILEGLRAITPGVPVVAEEKENPSELSLKGDYWLVDPLDGTRDFIAGKNEFAVSIGLLIDNQPLAGIIYTPAKDIMCYGDPNGVDIQEHGNSPRRLEPQKTRTPPRLLASRTTHDKLDMNECEKEGRIASCCLCSSAHKFILMAQGQADLYPRLGTTCEWDTAAGDAILRALGGGIVTLDGKTLAYGKPNWRNPNFLAYGPGYDKENLNNFLKLINWP